jgi:hypothetical protein
MVTAAAELQSFDRSVAVKLLPPFVRIERGDELIEDLYGQKCGRGDLSLGSHATVDRGSHAREDFAERNK